MEQFLEEKFYTPDMAKIIVILSAEEGIFTKKEVENALKAFFDQWFELFDEEKAQIIDNINLAIDFDLKLSNYMKKKHDTENDRFKIIGAEEGSFSYNATESLKKRNDYLKAYQKAEKSIIKEVEKGRLFNEGDHVVTRSKGSNNLSIPQNPEIIPNGYTVLCQQYDSIEYINTEPVIVKCDPQRSNYKNIFGKPLSLVENDEKKLNIN